MTAPKFYLVAGDTAFAMGEDGNFFCAPVCDFDNKVDGIKKGEIGWDEAWELSDIREEEQDYIEYVAHVCYYLKKAADLHQEQHNVFYIK
ncbi:hypothetical protein S-PM2d057 [Synechococcus phage S-PM2]|uniref:Hypothetical-Protein / belonging to T4-LIKE GC: 800 n=1 Tax=Synechococcus phage S-PM2 TaxID=238854 RepID=Q5GQX9_BPSYP|nr:Hypothetical-Protein / belonging to T4-LIKE GC: 800 [Synechococcus phage S-PM2]CAF34121.1 Hypothetical-Protein / belonging to T4-LIKE GC: 800 [Synechococcus phage S-PM2]CFW42167.1 hypothetical protein S-PM2d057 [Synechococcus phage S-PM2]